MQVEAFGISFTVCDAYIDQTRRIGDTYVGYKCLKLANKKYDGRDICDVCVDILEATPSRISWVSRQDREFSTEDLTKKQARLLKK